MRKGQLAMRVVSGNIRIGSVHETVESASKTMCGKRLNSNWWINGPMDPDTVTCPDCLKKRIRLEEEEED